MLGREHAFWSVAVFSTVTFVNTAVADYRDFKWYWYLLMAFLVIFSIVLNDVANKHSSLEKSEKKLENSSLEMIKRLHMISLSTRSASYFIILITSGISSFASMPSVPSYLFVLIGYLCAIGGAALPDYDLFIEVRHHRNAFTHSSMIPVVSGIWAILACPLPYLALMIPVSGFLIGYATHLFADHFPSNSTFAEGINMWRRKKSAPGNIVNISKERQNLWLFVNYNMIVPVVVFTLGRMSMSWFLDFSPAWNGITVLLEPGSIALIVYAIACVTIVLAMMIKWK